MGSGDTVAAVADDHERNAMTGQAASLPGEWAEYGDSGAQQYRRRRWLIGGLVLALVATGATLADVNDVFGSGQPAGVAIDSGSTTSLATVQRRTLSTQQEFNGTLGYAASYTVLAQAHGTVTWLPSVGQVVPQGQVLYRVDQAPVVLLYGSTPTYRTLAEGQYASDVKGRDVDQLNHDLVALGYVRKSDVDAAWNEFSWATKAGVEKLQHRLGVHQTGTLDLGAAVFLPTAARVTTLQATLGGPAAGPMLSATSTIRVVSVALDASLQPEVEKGDRVTITLPGGRTMPGRVSSVGTVATVPAANSGGPDNGPTVPVTIRLSHSSAAGSLDQALVEVSITDRTVRNVLAVQVTALLALAGGGYAVEVVASDGTHHLLPVTPGLFDDAAGLVQVSGPGLTSGQRVVVPGGA